MANIEIQGDGVAVSSSRILLVGGETMNSPRQNGRATNVLTGDGFSAKFPSTRFDLVPPVHLVPKSARVDSLVPARPSANAFVMTGVPQQS